MKPLFAANWKLQKTPDETRLFLTLLKESKPTQNILIFPPATSWEACAQLLKDSSIKWGAQNVWCLGSGAFTGENSATTLKAMGGTYALVGHSERRKLFGETDALLKDKVTYLQTLDLIPMLCIGETLEERERGQTNLVNRKQLQEALSGADRKKPLVVAYEPVWAIGTGKVATEAQVAEAHADIRAALNEMGFASTPILYGGSVKADNAGPLGQIPNVDGFLIGGASLEVTSLMAIAKA